MIILLYGKDTYRSRRKLNEVICHYKEIHKSGLNLCSLDGEELDFQEFRNVFRSVSMFNEKRLVVVRNIIGNENFKSNFIKNIEGFAGSKDVILFYQDGGISKDSFPKVIKTHGRVQEFEPLGGKKMEDWVAGEFAGCNTKITRTAMDKLIDSVGDNLWQMANEIKKLASFKTGSAESMVGETDVELLVRPKMETDIFKTIDAIASKNKKTAIRLLKSHIEKGDSPFYLSTMINFQFRNLIMVKSCESGCRYNAGTMAKKLGLHPFVIYKTLNQTKKFGIEELKKIYQKIFQADLDVKTGKVESETAMDLFIAQI